jgi:zinc D-Ala-D-Ala carboxypeptidase
MTRYRRSRLMLLPLALLVLIILGIVFHSPKTKPTTNSTTTTQSASLKYPIDKADSLWVVVNKGRALTANYVPAGLTTPKVPLRLAATNPEMMMRSDAAAAMVQLVAGAKADGLNLMLASAYRSYSEQIAVHESEVKSGGQIQADAVSAHPGHSEHQTGLAADLEPTSRICELEACFGNTPEGRWLDANAYKYGFIIRYQADKTTQTGYNYEPWHIRFIGKQLASNVHTQNVTLEKYFNLPFYTDYPPNSLVLK